MAENVFILGAGASFDAGAPLMSNFLDRAEDLFLQDAYRDKQGQIKKVFDAIALLQGVYSKSKLDLINIEALFGVIEMSRIIKKLGEYESEQIDEIRQALILLIVLTLEQSIKYPLKQGQIEPTSSYRSFVSEINQHTQFENTAIITFNYDIALDLAIADGGHTVNYNLTQKGSGVDLLKLHGSTNWMKEENSHEIFALDPNHVRGRFFNSIQDSTKVELCNSLPRLLAKENIGKSFEGLPVIVPPTWNKTEYHGTITTVWEAAARHLGEARNIYVMGYSLPESDSFFRYLYALGTLSNTRIRRFWVFDPDNSGALKDRYGNLLGEGIKSRFRYIEQEFAQTANYLSGIIFS